MENLFYTYQEYYTHTKAVLYVLIIISLIGKNLNIVSTRVAGLNGRWFTTIIMAPLQIF